MPLLLVTIYSRMIKINANIRIVIGLCIITVLIGCTEDSVDLSAELDYRLDSSIKQYSPTGESDFYILPDGSNLREIPQDPKNRLTTQKIELGKFLFFEPAFAVDAVHNSNIGTYSCATCHIPEKGFRPDNVQGIADGAMGYAYERQMNPDYDEQELDVQEARPLSLINVAFVKNTAWNGQFGAGGINVGTEDVWADNISTRRNYLGYDGLETQNIQGVTTHRMDFTESHIDSLGYRELFDKAFPEYTSANRYSKITGSLAISAYLRSVISDRAPFQDWLRGDRNAMSTEEKRGAILFFGKANCNRCHYNQNLGSLEFHALGVNDMDMHPESVKANNPLARRNLGRGGFTGLEEDLYKYKVPGIYNIGDAEFFFHGSSAKTLEEVIDYKDHALKENNRVPDENMSGKFSPLGLSEQEKSELVTFIRKSLRDPDMTRYLPEFVKSGYCFPNNDEASKAYLNCQ